MTVCIFIDLYDIFIGSGAHCAHLIHEDKKLKNKKKTVKIRYKKLEFFFQVFKLEEERIHLKS